jgi:hypothetical protein
LQAAEKQVMVIISQQVQAVQAVALHQQIRHLTESVVLLLLQVKVMQVVIHKLLVDFMVLAVAAVQVLRVVMELKVQAVVRVVMVYLLQ